MTLRTYTIERALTLPDGRAASVRLGLADDSYIPRRDQDTVVLELVVGDRHEAALATVLSPDQEDEGSELVRRLVAALESGEVEPTAGALEPYATTLP